MKIDFSNLSASARYHLMTQTIVPRPIAWVLTESGEENYNLAPFSYFTAVSSQPALMMFSVGKKPNGDRKDTVVNIEQTQRCVIHIASGEHAEQVTQTAATLEHGESEVTQNDIALTSLDGFPLPRVASAKIAFGCKLHEVIEMGATPQSLVFVDIETVYLDDTISDIADDRLNVDATSLDPLMRLGGQEYAMLKDVFTVNRPK
ncbi:flavin reductase family protein [Vibrio astriarenae]|uniref:flavin reductase family protein n=1 Tax=Vibrio astriarenae TaxID=1481923 RepID=UPI003735583A